MKLEFSRRIFKKKNQISNLMKVFPVGTDFFYAQTDGQKDRHDEGNCRLS